ncbi:MAG: ribosome maturation factor RimM [Hydrocarboniphaga effusa]|nr:ribosome maturation factor RimM [Hydrocarboniphaga effusa]
MSNPVPGNGRVALGHVTGVFGVQGWIKLSSYTRPEDGLLEYPRWVIRDKSWQVAEGRTHGASLVARLEGLQDRDAAMKLRGAEIEVERAELPPAKPGEIYWADLIGCEVVSGSGVLLGTVRSLYGNGAQDVLVVQGERQRLIPFVSGPIVQTVDLAARKIVVDWQPEY